MSDYEQPAELANFLDAHGRRVTAEVTRSDLAVILTRTPDEGLKAGPPALSRENAREIGAALLAWGNGEPQS